MNILLELIPKVAILKKFSSFTIYDLQFKRQENSKVEIPSNYSNLEFDHCTSLNHYQKCRSTNVEEKDIIDVDWPYVWVDMCTPLPHFTFVFYIFPNVVIYFGWQGVTCSLRNTNSCLQVKEYIEDHKLCITWIFSFIHKINTYFHLQYFSLDLGFVDSLKPLSCYR